MSDHSVDIQSDASKKLVNLGCGHRFHGEWINLDLNAHSPNVRKWDITKGLPFADGEIDAVYHSHVLEHLEPEVARALLRECFRVLRPGGTLRIAVPDLEPMARAYLDALQRVREGEPGADADHYWMTLELYDQVVRTRSGGEMLAYLKSGTVPNIGFIRERCGEETASLAAGRVRQSHSGIRIRNWRKTPVRLMRLLKRLVEQLILGKDYELLRAGRFRAGGEVHKWMYDAVSLRRLTTGVGFEDFRVCSAMESSIEAWPRFELDATLDGRVRKPNSLFAECKNQTR